MKRKYLLSIPIFIFGLCVNVNVIKADCDPGEKCLDTSISAESTATTKTSRTGEIVDDDGVDRFPNLNSNGEVSTFNKFTDKNGKTIAYVVETTSDKDVLIAAGVDPSIIKTPNDFNGILPKSSVENKNTASVWENFYDNLAQDFSYVDKDGNYKINPDNEGYKLGVMLGLYTGNSEEDTKNLWNGNSTGYNVVTASVVVINNKKQIITSENASSVCKKYINNYNNTASGDMGAYCRAIRDSVGKFADDGSEVCATCTERKKAECTDCSARTIAGLCCMEETGDTDEYGKCCMYFHSPAECSSGDNVNPPGDDDDDDDDECPLKTVKPTVYDPIPTHKSHGSEATCGGKYVFTDYSYSTDSCDITYETQTTTVISLTPLGENLIKYAGSSFTWNPIISQQETITRLYDTSILATKISALQTTITNTENLISNLGCQNDSAKKTIASQQQSINGLEKMVCSGTEQDIKDCQDDKSKAISDLNNSIDDLNKAIDEREKNIEKLKNDEKYKNAKKDIEPLNNCMNSANNYKSTTSSSTNVAKVTQEYMELKHENSVVYTSNKGEYVAINKNNGNLMTKAELTEEIVESGAYLTLTSDFYVPTTILDGTTGKVHRNISFDNGNKTVGYDCYLGAASTVKCKDEPCGDPIINEFNIIYRPISLSEPFPNTSNATSQYRNLGVNWSSELVDQYIKNNRNVSSYDVYNLTPIYTITLTPSTIKNVREYNKQHSYNDFNLTCEDGYKCLSKFLWEEFDGIVDTSKSCASSTGWDAACYNGGVSE